MKIFWSWQSDTPGRIGRHFVRRALEIAIEKLKTEVELDEPPSRELHLDHDRKGVPGSPDLANTILSKIRASSIFVADVTPVGKTPEGKSIMNPNVAIELGYALKHLGDESLLMVLNTACGDRESLPFNLKHKAGPILFSLNPESTKEDLLQAERLLSSELKVAIRDCVAALRKKSSTSIPKHVEVEPGAKSSVYFNFGEVIAEWKRSGKLFQVLFHQGPVLYLRLIPEFRAPELKRAEVKDIIFGIKINPLRAFVGGGASWEMNRFGGITYSHEEREGINLFTLSQVFTNREIWGLDATLLSGRTTIPMGTLEELYEAALKHYLDVATKLMDIKPPFIIKAGASGIVRFSLGWGRESYVESNREPIYQDEINSRQVLGNLKEEEVNKVLLGIFENFFDAVGEHRPKNFRGFPPEQIENLK